MGHVCQPWMPFDASFACLRSTGAPRVTPIPPTNRQQMIKKA
jgi:hypothetical protein